MVLVTILVLGLVRVARLASNRDLSRTRWHAVDPGLVASVNTGGALFNDVFSIYVAGFVVGAIVVCQPHILTKALYVKDDRAVKHYLIVFAVIFLLFQMLALVGFFSHLAVATRSVDRR